MPHWFADNSSFIGRGPLIRFDRMTEGAPAAGRADEGVLSRSSRGAVVAVATRLAKRLENAGMTIVDIVFDSGERYLSPILFEGLFDAKGLAA
jgi:hypothetical protein